VTVTWQEPISALYTLYQRAALEEELGGLEGEEQAAFKPVKSGRKSGQRASVKQRAQRLKRRVAVASPIGRLEIDRIGVDVPIVQGADLSSLRLGPGHYRGTDLPGEGGTVGISGHRISFSAPFRHLDKLKRGDPITVKMPYGRFTYEVAATGIETPDAVNVLDAGDQLVLTACPPSQR